MTKYEYKGNGGKCIYSICVKNSYRDNAEEFIKKSLNSEQNPIFGADESSGLYRINFNNIVQTGLRLNSIKSSWTV